MKHESGNKVHPCQEFSYFPPSTFFYIIQFTSPLSMKYSVKTNKKSRLETFRDKNSINHGIVKKKMRWISWVVKIQDFIGVLSQLISRLMLRETCDTFKAINLHRFILKKIQDENRGFTKKNMIIHYRSEKAWIFFYSPFDIFNQRDWVTKPFQVTCSDGS